MKFLLFASIFVSTNTFAQSIDLVGLKNIMTAKKLTLEKVNVGMTKMITTTSSIDVDGADCDFTQSAVQTVIKIESSKMIIHSQESFVPASSEACSTGGYIPFVESILFYEEVPSLVSDLKELDAIAKDIKSISRTGDIMTVTMNDLVTMKYDFSKSFYKSLVSNVGVGYSIITSEVPDVDVNEADLKDVLFCESSDSNRESCMRGDFSDILF